MIVENKEFSVKQIVELLRIINQLSQGIDPTSGLDFSDDTILNSDVIKRSLKDTALLIKYVVSQEPETRNYLRGDHKAPFFITKKQKEGIPIFEKSVSISKFAYEINNVCNSPTMSKLKATDITLWLQMHGYLEKIRLADGSDCKIATYKGLSIGITVEKKKNSNNIDYFINFYNPLAQKYVIDDVLNELRSEELQDK